MESISVLSNNNDSKDVLLSYKDLHIGSSRSIYNELPAKDSIDNYCDDILNRVINISTNQIDKSVEKTRDSNNSKFKSKEDEDRIRYGNEGSEGVDAMIENALSSIKSITIEPLINREHSKTKDTLVDNSNSNLSSELCENVVCCPFCELVTIPMDSNYCPGCRAPKKICNFAKVLTPQQILEIAHLSDDVHVKDERKKSYREQSKWFKTFPDHGSLQDIMQRLEKVLSGDIVPLMSKERVSGIAHVGMCKKTIPKDNRSFTPPKNKDRQRHDIVNVSLGLDQEKAYDELCEPFESHDEIEVNDEQAQLQPHKILKKTRASKKKKDGTKFLLSKNEIAFNNNNSTSKDPPKQIKYKECPYHRSDDPTSKTFKAKLPDLVSFQKAINITKQNLAEQRFQKRKNQEPIITSYKVKNDTVLTTIEDENMALMTHRQILEYQNQKRLENREPIPDYYQFEVLGKFFKKRGYPHAPKKLPPIPFPPPIDRKPLFASLQMPLLLVENIKVITYPSFNFITKDNFGWRIRIERIGSCFNENISSISKMEDTRAFYKAMMHRKIILATKLENLPVFSEGDENSDKILGSDLSFTNSSKSSGCWGDPSPNSHLKKIVEITDFEAAVILQQFHFEWYLWKQRITNHMEKSPISLLDVPLWRDKMLPALIERLHIQSPGSASSDEAVGKLSLQQICWKGGVRVTYGKIGTWRKQKWPMLVSCRILFQDKEKESLLEETQQVDNTHSNLNQKVLPNSKMNILIFNYASALPTKIFKGVIKIREKDVQKVITEEHRRDQSLVDDKRLHNVTKDILPHPLPLVLNKKAELNNKNVSSNHSHDDDPDMIDIGGGTYVKEQNLLDVLKNGRIGWLCKRLIMRMTLVNTTDGPRLSINGSLTTDDDIDFEDKKSISSAGSLTETVISEIPWPDNDEEESKFKKIEASPCTPYNKILEDQNTIRSFSRKARIREIRQVEEKDQNLRK